MKFKVYVDFTITEPIQPFYVGKGVECRVNFIERNVHHKNIISKHGINRVILFESDDEQEALNKEIELIATYHTFINDPSYSGIGCNYTTGGEGISGYHHTSSTKNLISSKCAGRKHTDEEIQKQILMQKGRIISKEERNKRSLSRKDKKAVIQFDVEGNEIARFESQKSAAKALGVKSHANIGACCRCVCKTAYGFIWKYLIAVK